MTDYPFNIKVTLDKAAAERELDALQKKLSSGKPVAIKATVDQTGLIADAGKAKAAAEKALGRISINVQGAESVKQLQANLLNAAKSAELVKTQLNKNVNVGSINVVAKSYADLDAKLKALIPTIKQVEAQLGRPLNINAQVIDPKAVAAQTNASLAAVQGSINRFASRVGFLVTAMVAQFATDIVLESVQDFNRLEAQIRGVEIASTRAGLAGGKMFREMTSEADNFRFKAQDAADTLNKLFIGGLQPTPGQVQQIQQTAVGAALMFGESPSKMMDDLATAALRTSYRIADNLGIVIRANETYDKYAATIGKTRDELTATEKAQAFLNEMLTASGAEALRAASALDTNFMVIERGKVQLNELKLAFGATLSEGLMPLISAFADMDSQTIKAIANWTITITKVGALIAVLNVATAATKALAAANAAAGAGGLLASLGVWLSNPVTGTILAVAAALSLAAKSAADYEMRMQKANSALLDAMQVDIMFGQHMAAIGFATKEAAAETTAFSAAMQSIGAGGEFTNWINVTLSALDTFPDALLDVASAYDATGEVVKEYSETHKKSLDEVKEKILEAIESSKNETEAKQKVADVINNEYIPATRDMAEAVKAALEQQARDIASTLTSWENFAMGVDLVVAGILDTIASGTAFIATGLASMVSAVASAVVAAAASAANAIIDIINAAIMALNVLPGIGPTGMPMPGTRLFNLKTLGHVGAGNKGFADNFSWMFGATGGAAAGNLTGEIFTGKTPVGPYGMSWDEAARMKWNERRKLKGDAAAARAKGYLDDEYVFSPDLYFEGPGGKKKKGGGGGGKAEKTIEDKYKDLIEKLNEQLANNDAEIAIQQEMLKLGSTEAETKIQQIEKAKDTAYYEFYKSVKAQDMLPLLDQDKGLREKITAALTDLSIATEKTLEEARKEAGKVLDNYTEASIENDTRKAMGLVLDDSKGNQEALNGVLDLMKQQGIRGVDQLAGFVESIGLSREKMGQFGDMLTDAANFLLSEADQMKKDAAEKRREAMKLGFSIEDQRANYAADLAAAREPDQNRDMVYKFNALIDQLDKEIARTAFVESAQQALEAEKAIEALHVQVTELGTSIGEHIKVPEKLKAIIDEMDTKVAGVLPGLQAQADKAPDALFAAADQLSGSASALYAAADALMQAASALGSINQTKLAAALPPNLTGEAFGNTSLADVFGSSGGTSLNDLYNAAPGAYGKTSIEDVFAAGGWGGGYLNQEANVAAGLACGPGG